MVRIIDDQWDPLSRTPLKRLEALLALWLHPAYWRPPDDHYHHATPHASPPALSGTEWELWKKFLLTSEICPPASTPAGLRRALRLLGRRASQHPVKEIACTAGMMRIGRRLTFKRASQTPRFGRRWYFATAYSEPLETLLSKRFLAVERIGDHLLAQEPSAHNDSATAGFMVAEAAALGEARSLFSSYAKAHALDLAGLFVESLPTPIRTALAEELGSRLKSALRDLHWISDFRLAIFEHYEREVDPPTSTASSRMACLLEAERELNRLGGHFGSSAIGEHHFDTLAYGFALAAEASQLGNVLRELPAGRAVLVIADALCRHRPTVLAQLSFHPAWVTDASFCVAAYLREHRDHWFRDIDLSDEWQETQGLTRMLLLRPGEDGALVEDAFDLALHDEGCDEAARFTERPSLRVPLEARMKPWAALIDSPNVVTLVQHVKTRLARGDLSTQLAVFVLRIIQLLGAAANQSATELAAAFAAAYERAVSAGEPPQLASHGQLLASLWSRLAGDNDAIRRWLRPLDLPKEIEAILVEQGRGGSSSGRERMFAVPRMLRTHVEALVATAETGGSNGAPLAREAAAIFLEERAADIHVHAFSWLGQADVELQGESLVKRIARALATLGDDAQAQRQLRTLMREGPTLLELAQWASGLEPTHPMFAEAVAHIRDLASAPDATSVALGEATHCAVALLDCGLETEAERFARSALGIAERFKPRMLHLTEYVAIQVLFKSLVLQRRWDAVLEVTLGTDVPSEWARVISNWHAVAYMQKGLFDEANREFDRVLRIDPENTMANANRFITWSVQERWDEALEALKTVDVDALPEPTRRAAARELGARGAVEQAASVLRGLPAPVTAEAGPETLGESTPVSPMTAIVPEPTRPVHEMLLIEEICRSAVAVAEKPQLVLGKSEDDITALIELALSRIGKDYDVTCGRRQGHGAADEESGVTDIAIKERGTGLVVVTGEAKKWKGELWASKGLHQAFGTATRTEAFLLLVLYCQTTAIDSCVATTTELVTRFAVEHGGKTLFKANGPVEDVTPERFRELLRVLRSIHVVDSAAPGRTRIVYTVLADLAHEAAKAARLAASSKHKENS